ncbi:MAG: ABC transporter ATP-binding protein [Nitrososphaerota archaeon]|nr:ABC transporter ATP-binding protein [Nitrososphaerota archaeon]
MSLKVEGLTKFFGEVVALDGMTFSVPSGSFTAVLGPSGCGKTTLLRCIAGVETPDSGRIMLGNSVVFSSKDSVNIQPERRNVGMVYQSYALWPHMTVYDNVAFPLKVRKESADNTDSMVTSVLERLGIEGLAGRYPSELSGGQQQRVALARALVYRPPVLLLDEPLSGLDESMRRNVAKDLKSLQESLRLDTIYVTHNREEALWLGDEIIVMNRGKLIASGQTDSLIRNPPNAYTASFLGGMILFKGTLISRNQRYVLVQTEIGKLMCRSVDGFSPGANVLIGINEKNILIQSSDSAENKVTVTIESMIGIQPDGSYEYNVVAGGKRFSAVSKSGDLPNGATATLSLSASDCVAIPNA